MFKNSHLGDDDRLHVKEAWPVLITRLTHMFCQKNGTKWDQFRLDAARLCESSFSKTLISGPQISCQSSAVDRHRIGEKAVPNKSTTCQSRTQTRAHSHQHEKVHTSRRVRIHTHTHTNVSHTVTFPPLD